jgi:hypothetical protein
VTGVTENCRSEFARASHAQVIPDAANVAAPQANGLLQIGCGWTDSDSEIGRKRSFLERRLGPGALAIPVVGRCMSEVITGNADRVVCLRSGHAAPQSLPDKGSYARAHVVARAVRSHVCRSGRRRVAVARALGSHGGIAPYSAQQRDARACGNCQRDRKDDCSEHWGCSLPLREQGVRQIQEPRIASNLGEYAEIWTCTKQGLRDFVSWCRKFLTSVDEILRKCATFSSAP